MQTISESIERPGLCTVLDHRVDGPDTQLALIDALAGVHEGRLSSYPGYESALFLASLDGRRVVNLVRWDTEDDFRAFEASDDHPAVMADIQAALTELPGLEDTAISRFHAVREVRARPEAARP